MWLVDDNVFVVFDSILLLFEVDMLVFVLVVYLVLILFLRWLYNWFVDDVLVGLWCKLIDMW